ncbi:MAG: ribosome recycling factor, partial [Candidatus Latescibacteria bacterium]|nr:ribosome recycling factor [bacterium]MBD3423031.1 ribosome recycling factor [Candidatus Latescibacterota bacterium]
SRTVDEVVENGRIAIRNIRREANDKFKKLEKAHEISEDDSYRYQEDIQEKTDQHIKTLDEIGERKKKEILEF